MATSTSKTTDPTPEPVVEPTVEPTVEETPAPAPEAVVDLDSEPALFSTAVSEHVRTDLAASGTSPTLDEYRDQAKKNDENEPSTA